MDDLYYSDYIELDKILNSQHPKSFEALEEGNDEMLFIIVHQVYELWFKQIIFELDLVRHIFIQGRINDNSDDMSKVVYKLKRIGKILELINQQVSVLETMTALDFLEFRNVLLPASGFQSKQFNKQTSAMDFAETHKFWLDYREAYQNSLSKNETGRLKEFDRVFFEEGRGDIPPVAMRAALFITIYRNLPIFHLPFELLNTLSEIDELLSNWRYRHFMMVRRMIGLRVGTGGTSGAGYLEGTLSQHYAFREITEVATFLIERSKRPALPKALKEKVSFNIP